MTSAIANPMSRLIQLDQGFTGSSSSGGGSQSGGIVVPDGGGCKGAYEVPQKVGTRLAI